MKAYYLLFLVLVAICYANTLNRQPVVRSNVPDENLQYKYLAAASSPRPGCENSVPDTEDRFSAYGGAAAAAAAHAGGYVGGHLGGHIGDHLGSHVRGHVGGHLGARAAAGAAGGAGAYGGGYAG